MSKKIYIDASGGQTYGSKFHIRSFVKYFTDVNDKDKLTVFVKQDYLNIKHDNLKIVVVPAIKFKVLRILFSTIILPLICLFRRVDTIYYPFDVGSFLPISTKIILGIKNPNFILPSYLVTLKFSGIHKFVSKTSSFFSNTLLFPSQTALKEISKHLYNVSNKKFIYHGLDFSDWINSNEDQKLTKNKYIFFCSNMYKFKNIEVLITAISHINHNSEEKMDLILCGDFVDDSYKLKIFSMVDEFDIKNRVIFLSKLSRSTIVNLYQNSELIVIPTKFETFGHMYLESLYSRRPVVVAETIIANEIVKNSVLYFKADDYIQLSNIIIEKEYLKNHSKRMKRGIDIVENFSIKRECKELYNLVLDY